jgi:CheY-like chemotaxis protein
VRILATSVLEGGGFRVRTAGTGAEGLALCRALAGEVAIVVLDLTMPGLSGIETMRKLAELRPDLPVVLMSGYNREEIGDQLERGARTPFVKKPFVARELLAAVRQALETRGRARSS